MSSSAGLIIAITRGLIRSAHTRRTAMFIIVVIALLMLFGGATFLSGVLTEHPFGFVCYWAICAWLTLTAVLLALFDLVAVRALARSEQNRIKSEIFGARDKEDV